MVEKKNSLYNLEKLLFSISSLVELSESMVTYGSFALNMKAILHQILGTLLIPKGIIFYYDSDSGTLERIVSRGSNAKKKVINLEAGISDLLVEREQIIRLGSERRSESDDEFGDLFDEVERALPEARIWVSLVIKNNFVGALILGEKFMNGEFTPEDNDILKIVSRILAITIFNFRLIDSLNRKIEETKKNEEQLKKRKLELEVLYDVGLEVTFLSESVEDIVNKILINAVGLLDAGGGVLYLIRSSDENVLLTPAASVNVDPDKIDSMDINEEPIRYAIEEQVGSIRSSSVDNNQSVFPGSELLTVPIIYKKKVLGLFLLVDKEGRGESASFSEDDKKLLIAFANQAAVSIENARLYRDSIEKQKIEREIELAAEIQRGLIPVNYPDVKGFEIDGTCIPCRMVGGDYLNYFVKPDGKVLFVLTDVSGKGIPAALLVSSINSVLYAQIEEESSLCNLVSVLSRSIYYSSTSSKYATAFFAELEPKTGTVEFVNAGHNPPILINAGRENVDFMKGGFTIGMFDNSTYESASMVMEKKDVLLIYTDGITEQTDMNGEFFEEQRLKETVNASIGLSAKKINRRVIESVMEHAGTQPINDDMTLLTLKRLK